MFICVILAFYLNVFEIRGKKPVPLSPCWCRPIPTWMLKPSALDSTRDKWLLAMIPKFSDCSPDILSASACPLGDIFWETLIVFMKYIESATLHTRMDQNWGWTFVACYASCLVVCDGSIYGATPCLPPPNTPCLLGLVFYLGEYHDTSELCRQVVNASFAQKQVEWGNWLQSQKQKSAQRQFI